MSMHGARTFLRRGRRRDLRALAVVAVAGLAAGCGPQPGGGGPSEPEPIPTCPTERTEAIAPPVARSGVIPPSLPPGVTFPGQTNGVEPLAEAYSANGRWHLWAVGEDRVATGLGSRTVRKVVVYAKDEQTDDVPDVVAWFWAVLGMYSPSLGDGIGYPGTVAFAHIEDSGAGFVTAIDYRERVTVGGLSYSLPPEEARLHLSLCG
jgi:hypothetical protein